MASQADLRAHLKAGPQDKDAVSAVASALSSKKSREALVELGSEAVPMLDALLHSKGKKVAARAAEIAGSIGPEALPLAESLATAARSKDKATRKAALDAILSVGGEPSVYRDAVKDALGRADQAVIPIIATWGPPALPLVKGALAAKKTQVRKVGLQALVEIAGGLQGHEVEQELIDFLEDWDREALQVLALEVVARLRKPPASLTEPVADLSSMRGSKRALLRFDKTRVKRELRSLIKSQSKDERVVGLEIVGHYGNSASEFAELVQERLATDTSMEGSVAAVHALGKLLDGDALGEALAPALDHWSDDVQAVAKEYLEEADVPVRESVWEGHPFSTSLVRQLQRFGFKPTGSAMRVPDARPYEHHGYGEGFESDEEAPLPETLSPAVWALLEMLEWPPYELFTVWGSSGWDENTMTFHFSREPGVLPIRLNGGAWQIMTVIGDGSIGYYACIDLLDTSDDPAVYYLERWWPEGWRVSRTLSGYLRRIGRRRG